MIQYRAHGNSFKAHCVIFVWTNLLSAGDKGYSVHPLAVVNEIPDYKRAKAVD